MRARLIVAWMVMAAGLAVLLPVEPAGAAEDIGDITTFTRSGVDRPSHITLGPDRNLWFASRDTDRIGRITVNGTISLFSGPATGTNRIDEPYGITAGPDGRIWFTIRGTNRIGRMTTAGGGLTTFGNANIQGPRGIVAGPDGALWFTSLSNGRLGRITTSGVVTTFSNPGFDLNSNIENLVLGPDGNLWFGEFKGSSLWRFNPTTEVFTEFGLGVSGPQQLTVGPDDRIWVAVQFDNAIAVIDPLAADDTAIQNSVDSYTNANIVDPQGISAAADGNIWFTSGGNDRVGYLDPDAVDPATTITTFTDPAGNIDGAFIMTEGPDGHPWFTARDDDRIGQVRASNCNTAPFPHGFTDVAPAVYYESGLDWAKCHDLVSGFPDNSYHPDEEVNRGQIVSILWVMMGSPGGSPAHGFPDIPNNVFYEQALRWAKAEGLVTGFPNGQYKPRDPVNRCQLTNMMWQLVGAPGPLPAHPYTDVSPASFCNDAIDWAVANNLWDDDIVSGTTFLPKAGATRAQVADVVYELASVGDAWDEFVGTFPDTVRFPT